jgi:hypothetical protein
MLQSAPDALADDVPIRILNDWPKDWDAAFRLLARGGFVVSSAQVSGQIPLVEIQARFAGECLLRNPWGNAPVSVWRGSRRLDDLTGETLRIPMRENETLVVVPQGMEPARIKLPK